MPGGDGLVSALTLRTDVQPPQIKLTINRATPRNQTLYFKGISESKFATAEVYIVVCQGEKLTASSDSYVWLDQVSTSGDGALEWGMTSAVTYLLLNPYQGLPPLFYTDTKGCTITHIEAYTDQDLSQKFSGNENIKSITQKSNHPFPPTLTISYQRQSAFAQTLHFKGSNQNTFAKTSITFRVCDLPVSKSLHTIYTSVRPTET